MDYDAINRGVVRLSVLAAAEVPARVTLRRLCEVASVALDADGVGVMLTDESGNRFVHASTDKATELERLQEALQSGPCREASDSGEPVVAADDAAFARWPDFTARTRGLTVRATAAIPLMARDRCWGVLDLYRLHARDWSEEELDAAALLASVATAHLVMAADRDTTRDAQLQLAYQSNHDHLTGLPNHALLLDRLELALAAAPRWGSAVGLLLVDVDPVETTSSRHGRSISDAVLREVARRLVSSTRAGDTVSRSTGNDFLVVCDHLIGNDTSAAAFGPVVDRVRTALSDPIEHLAGLTTVDVRIGAAIATPQSTVHSLITDAEDSLRDNPR